MSKLTGVKVCSSLFLHRVLAFAVVLDFVVPHVALHRVSVRTLDELA
jgi:hypothetical protein